MKNQLKRKLRSSQGMTLLLSLLLFLVCVVAGSVVLTAGTATSGTLSERAKLDQRYFSVTSAAELLRQKFDGKSVTVTVTGSDVNATIKREEVDDPIDYDNANTEEKFVIDQSLYLLDKLVNSPDDDDPKKIAWTEKYQQIITNRPASAVAYTLKMNPDSGEINSLRTTVTVNFTPSGLTFQLENENGDNEKFRLQMEYTAVILQEDSADVTTYHIDWRIGTIGFGN